MNMAFLNLFKKKKLQTSGENYHNNGLPVISKAMFIEDQDPLEKMEIAPVKKETKGIEEIYFFLQQDYETRGYNDALTNPDQSYRAEFSADARGEFRRPHSRGEPCRTTASQSRRS
jgi:hypothetical protein